MVLGIVYSTIIPDVHVLYLYEMYSISSEDFCQNFFLLAIQKIAVIQFEKETRGKKSVVREVCLLHPFSYKNLVSIQLCNVDFCFRLLDPSIQPINSCRIKFPRFYMISLSIRLEIQ
jgi:hypothetical protein